MRARLRIAAAAAVALAGLAALALPGRMAPPGPDAPADRALPPLPRDGPLDILAFGTSLTAGNDWPEALAAQLGDCLGRPVAVSRLARPGAGSDWGLSVTGRAIAAAPDLVLLEFSINDADILDGQGLAAARASHEAILARLAAALPGTRVLLMSMSPARGLRGLVRPRLARHYAALRDLARAHDAGLADLHPRWLAAGAGRAELPDGLHPTDAAARRVILPAVTGLIARAAGIAGSCSTPGRTRDPPQ